MKSAYNLTKVSAPGTNTITKYEINPETKAVTPHYYTVTLKQTAFGTGPDAKYYKWGKECKESNNPRRNNPI